jgi:hypothetical protein
MLLVDGDKIRYVFICPKSKRAAPSWAEFGLMAKVVCQCHTAVKVSNSLRLLTLFALTQVFHPATANEQRDPPDRVST